MMSFWLYELDISDDAFFFMLGRNVGAKATTAHFAIQFQIPPIKNTENAPTLAYTYLYIKIKNKLQTFNSFTMDNIILAFLVHFFDIKHKT